MKQLYSIYDKKVQAYGPIFEARTHGEAERMFQDAQNQDGSNLKNHKADFDLHHVGKFNEETGQLHENTQAEVIMNGEENAS